MKILFFIPLFFCFCGVSSAQDELMPIPKSESKFRWGVNASSEYAYRTLKATGELQLDNASWIIDARNGSERGLLGYHVGGSISYQPLSFLEFETGLDFSRQGFSTKKYDDLIFAGDQSSNLLHSLRFSHNWYYLSIPLNLNFSFGQKSIRFISSIGGSWDYLIQAQSVSMLKSENGSRTRSATNVTDNYSNMNVTVTFGAGVEINMKEKAALRIQPNIRYGLVQIIDAPITANLWSLGMKLGLYRKF